MLFVLGGLPFSTRGAEPVRGGDAPVGFVLAGGVGEGTAVRHAPDLRGENSGWDRPVRERSSLPPALLLDLDRLERLLVNDRGDLVLRGETVAIT